jgi:hypothetical protein
MNFFVSFKRKGHILILIIYIDDLFITQNDIMGIDWMNNQLFSQFKNINWKTTSKYLGFEFEQRIESIFIHERNYTLEVLMEFDHL